MDSCLDVMIQFFFALFQSQVLDNDSYFGLCIKLSLKFEDFGLCIKLTLKFEDYGNSILLL